MRVAVIGLGKLGCPMAAVFASKGHTVIGIDTNEETVAKVNAGESPVQEPELESMLKLNYDRIYALPVSGLCPSDIIDCELIFIVVPTPSDSMGKFSNKCILQVLGTLGAVMQGVSRYQTIVIVSTIMPTSMDEVIGPALSKASRKQLNKDFGLCYSPEFIALGCVVNNMLNPDMLIIGQSGEKSGDILEKFYNSICCSPVHRMNFVEAELAKISVNAYITMKISFANMLGEVCDKLPCTNVGTITKAIGDDKRIGRRYLEAATAFGGPCFPRDTTAFIAMSQELQVEPNLIIATNYVNQRQSRRLASIVRNILPVNGIVGVLGLSYKPDTNVIEESAAIGLIKELQNGKSGISITVYDPIVKSIPIESITYAESMEECKEQASVLIIMVPHREFTRLEFAGDAKSNMTVIDCWGILRHSYTRIFCNYLIPGVSDAS